MNDIQVQAAEVVVDSVVVVVVVVVGCATVAFTGSPRNMNPVSHV